MIQKHIDVQQERRSQRRCEVVFTLSKAERRNPEGERRNPEGRGAETGHWGPVKCVPAAAGLWAP